MEGGGVKNVQIEYTAKEKEREKDCDANIGP